MTNDSKPARSHRTPIEPLEHRTLLSDIFWVNEGGDASGDSDNFNAVYGANATVARAIVNRAISDWERVIENFNRTDGTNFYELDIEAEVFSDTLRGRTSFISSADGKPTDADIELDDNGGNVGWYFDPTIGSSSLQDDGEFTGLVTPFAANGDSSAVGLDFYRTTLHEIGHAMGISEGWFLHPLAIDDFLTEVGTDPVDGTSTLYGLNINGGPFEATFTDAGGLHLYEGPSVNGLPVHPNELLNPGRAVSAQHRRLISDFLAITLQQAYGYTIRLPSLINTFHANLNTSTDVLRVTGNGNEDITIEMVGGSIRVLVNGTIEQFPASEVGSIVVEGGPGADTLTINSLTANRPVTFNGGTGNDTLILGLAGQNLDAIDSNITFNDPGAAGDSIVLHDQRNSAISNVYTINQSGTTFDRTNFPFLSFSNIQNFTLHAGSVRNTINLQTSPTSLTTTINAGGGDDFINIAAASGMLHNVAGPVVVNGDAGGADEIFLWDNFSAQNDVYTVTGNQFQHAGFGGLTYGTTIEKMTLLGGSGDNVVAINSTPVGTAWSVSAGAGDDQIDIAPTGGNLSDVRGPLTINGEIGSDDLTLHDNLTTGTDAYSITSSNVDRAVFGGVTYGTVDTLQLLAETGLNVFDISSTAAGTTTTISANTGNDIFNVGMPGNSAVNIDGALILQGEGGTDTVFYTDQSNASATTYGISNNTITRTGAATTTFNTVETFDLRSGSGVDTINIATSSGNIAMSINAGIGNDVFNVNPTGHTGAALNGTISLNGNTGFDDINVNDASNFQSTISISNTAFSRTFAAPYSFSNADSLTWNGGPNDETYFVSSTLATCPVVVNAANGNDDFFVDGGISPPFVLDDIDGALTLNGQGGTQDSFILNDSSNAAAVTFNVTAASVARTGMSNIGYGTMESLTMNLGSGVDTVNVNSTAAGCPVVVNGNNGDDIFSAGFGDIDLNLLAAVTFNGNIGTDRLTVSDIADTGTDTYTVTSTATSKNSGGGPVNYATIENYTLNASSADSTINVNSALPAPFAINAQGGVDTINVATSAGGSFVTVDGGPGFDNLNVNSGAGGTAHVRMLVSQEFATLNVLSGGTAVVSGDGDILTRSLSIAPTGLLDLAGNNMVVDYTGGSPLSTIQGWINSARNGGAWNGNGLTSSAAASNSQANTTLGAMEATDFDRAHGAGAFFNGLDPDDTAVLVKYTYYGDANFSGSVNFDDYVRIDVGFNTGLTGWANGDFNYSGAVNFDDYVLIDIAFNTQSGTLGRTPRRPVPGRG